MYPLITTSHHNVSLHPLNTPSYTHFTQPFSFTYPSTNKHTLTQYTYTIGGIFDLFVPIRYPTSIDFSASGELAICDTGLKKIYLLTPYMTLIKAFQVPFRYTEVIKPQKRSAGIQSSFHQSAGLSDNNQHNNDDGDGDDDDDDDNHSQNDPTTTPTSKRVRTVTTIDDKPVAGT